MNKRNVGLMVIAILSLCTLFFSFQTKNSAFSLAEDKWIQLKQGQSVSASDINDVREWNSLMESEIARGNLRLALTQSEENSNYIHERFDQYYQGLRVLGAQLIRHFKDDQVYCINGSYYRDVNVSSQPSVGEDNAIQTVKSDLLDPDYRMLKEPELIVYPGEEKFYLSYQITFQKRGSEMVYYIDAHSGAILLKFDNIKITATIGLGKGHHGDSKKLATDNYSGYHWTKDVWRFSSIKTYDLLYNYTIWNWYAYTDSNIGYDSDNRWDDSFNDKSTSDGHNYVGLTYDYFYDVHGRKGLNNNNTLCRVFVNFDIYKQSNAFYDSYDNSLNFFDGDGITYLPFCAALDIVAHEYSHGVTRYCSNLYYWSYSGALNEAFSDIMSVCAEFYQQPQGTGFLYSDWLQGEDVFKTFYSGQAIRRLDKPYLLSWWGGAYPDHWSLRYTGSADNYGVHINSNIINHCFYLLANGGTNRVSGITVQGIGISKAEKIFYRAFVYYMSTYSDFWSARTACLYAAWDLFGLGSSEFNATAFAFQAVGVY